MPDLDPDASEIGNLDVICDTAGKAATDDRRPLRSPRPLREFPEGLNIAMLADHIEEPGGTGSGRMVAIQEGPSQSWTPAFGPREDLVLDDRTYEFGAAAEVSEKELGHDAYPRTNRIAATSKQILEGLIPRQRVQQDFGLNAPSPDLLTERLVVRSVCQEFRIGFAGKCSRQGPKGHDARLEARFPMWLADTNAFQSTPGLNEQALLEVELRERCRILVLQVRLHRLQRTETPQDGPG